MSEQAAVSIPQGLVEAVRGAKNVAVLTGAGISAESGLPTFRDPQTGLWEKFRPEDLATPEAFQRNPKLVWEWYAHRRELMGLAQPNPGHAALAAIERHAATFTLVTQNIDGLHQRAGSRNVLELHGNITRTRCFEEDTLVESWSANGEVPPRCPRCGGLLRPDVVWFGESLPEETFEQALEAAIFCDLFFSIGTSGLVEPAASLTEVARRAGATIIVLNLEVEPLASPDLYQLNGPAGQILPELVRQAWRDEV